MKTKFDGWILLALVAVAAAVAVYTALAANGMT